MSTVVSLPERKTVPESDTWDLNPLYSDDTAWEAAFTAIEGKLSGFDAFRGRLAEGAETIASFLKLDAEIDRALERLGNYAFLKQTQDQADSEGQRRQGRFINLATRAAQANSWFRPELLAISDDPMKKMLASPALAHYRLLLDRIIRYRPHTLTTGEEKLLAMQGEMAQTASKAFRQLTDADMKFGHVENEHGQQVELSQSTFMQLLISPKQSVRRTAFHQFYDEFAAHENTIAATLNGSLQNDVYFSRARNYPSALESALFADNVPVSVYDNLIATVRAHLPAVHKFYEIRRRKMKLDEIHHYDTYVPILSDLKKHHTWEQASQVVLESLKPLGTEYCEVLADGLGRARWCDRYPNKGKQSGAFSSGGFDGPPYIMMNFKSEVFDDVFTLTHEAGHSMHSWHSKRKQSFEYYNYVIFVAEVASTFNEQLLSEHLMERATDPREKAYLINKEIDSIRATIVRQTMFAEFEKISHAAVESGEPMTVKAFKEIYGKLLRDYFGPQFVIDEPLQLECLRIPHFYRAFYVYKYATGLSAAIALSRKVLKGGPADLKAYVSFLEGGCSKWPLDLLRDAGVDMEQPAAVETAMKRFSELTDQLDKLV